MPQITPPWWAEALVLIAFAALAVWIIYADTAPQLEQPWMALTPDPPT